MVMIFNGLGAGGKESFDYFVGTSSFLSLSLSASLNNACVSGHTHTHGQTAHRTHTHTHVHLPYFFSIITRRGGGPWSHACISTSILTIEPLNINTKNTTPIILHSRWLGTGRTGSELNG